MSRAWRPPIVRGRYFRPRSYVASNSASVVSLYYLARGEVPHHIPMMRIGAELDAGYELVPDVGSLLRYHQLQDLLDLAEYLLAEINSLHREMVCSSAGTF